MPGAGTCLSRAVLAQMMLPVSGIVAAFFFLRGHNAPGGGFVAGLVMAMGFLLQYVVSGTDWVEDRVRAGPEGPDRRRAAGWCWEPRSGSLVVGYPLLTSHTFHVSIPAGRARSTSAAR